MPTYPTVDQSKARLHLHGWSVGEVCLGSTWQVDGSKGKDRILAQGRTQRDVVGGLHAGREVSLLAPAQEG